ncbi:hypothetical protein NEF87_003817 [Candidatus Lokiarchaeum ossiferum]|uniref:PIN domain-containing protein n=1 Tax=Candidatus Lokiarchaeum ossiferum TaxID=2951803 RepID=A0ABY6HXF5_9ARCH|nr:hypothetical protein NEF87_003817 [Candidatus Lokiarchaeum sp. B-35]
MLLFLDTCALLEINRLTKEEKIHFEQNLEAFRIGVTAELLKEYHHYQLNSLIQIDFTVEISEEERQKYVNQYLLHHLDQADQELFITGHRDLSVIISNDRDLILQCQAHQINCDYLWSFLLGLVRADLLSKNIFYKCFHNWEQRKRYDKKVLAKIKQIYHSL